MKKLFQGLHRRNPLCKLREILKMMRVERRRSKSETERKRKLFSFYSPKKPFWESSVVRSLWKLKDEQKILIKNNFPTCPHHHDDLFIFLIAWDFSPSLSLCFYIYLELIKFWKARKCFFLLFKIKEKMRKCLKWDFCMRLFCFNSETFLVFFQKFI